MRRHVTSLLLLAIAAPGCGRVYPHSAEESLTLLSGEARYAPGLVAASAPPAAPPESMLAATSNVAMAGMMGMSAPAQDKLAEATPPDLNKLARKIVYDAQIDLVVEEIEKAADALGKLVRDSQGYVAEQNLVGSPGSTRSGRWKVRIPVEGFEDFTAQIARLGELERNLRTSQDVTEQYYDTEARIKNKKVEEQTLIKILDERGGKLEDVLKVEVELSRVRGEIEQLEGRIRLLQNLSSLSTVTVNLRERERFDPPAPVVASFPTKIARTWDESLRSLTDAFQALVLWGVSWIVWIPFLAVALLLGWTFIRRTIRALVRNAPRLWAIARMPISPPSTPS